MDDQIKLQRIQCYGYHGVFPEENRLGQRFFVDVTIFLDIRPASLNDDIQQTINYAEIYQLVSEAVERKCFKLIETLAEYLATEILKRFKINAVEIELTKPDPPIPGYYNAVSVKIKRGTYV